MINDFINMVSTRLNPKAHISGILITRWETSNLSRGIEAKLREAVGDTVFQTKFARMYAWPKPHWNDKTFLTMIRIAMELKTMQLYGRVLAHIQ